MIAAHQGSEDIVKVLLEFNPNITQTDKFGKKATDRALTQNICYLIQSATIDHKINRIKESKEPTISEKSKKPIKTAAASATRNENFSIRSAEKPRYKSPISMSQRGGKFEESKKVNLSKDETVVLSYYREKFMEQIALLSQKLSQKSAFLLEQIIQEELNKAENFIRGIVGNELETLSSEMKKQIDQHVILKTKLAAAKAGVAEILSESPKHVPENQASSVKIKFPNSASKKPQVNPQTKYDNLQKKAAQKTITRLNQTIDSLIDSKEDVLHSTKRGAFSPRNLPKDKQDIYCALKKEIMAFVGKKMDEIAESIALENRDNINGILKERLAIMEREMRLDIKKSINDLGKNLKAHVDSSVNEKVTRIQKHCKVSKDEELKSLTERAKFEQSSRQEDTKINSSKKKYLMLTDLQNSIRHLDSSYTALLDAENNSRRIDNSRQKLKSSSKKGRNNDDHVRSLSNNSKDSLGASKSSIKREGSLSNRPDLSPYYAKLSATAKSEDLHIDMPKQQPPPSGKGFLTDRGQEISAEKPPRQKGYVSIQKLAEEGKEAKVNYNKADPHNSRVLPIPSKYSTPRTAPREIGEEVPPLGEENTNQPTTLPPPDPSIKQSPPHFIGDTAPGSEGDQKMNSILAKYSNVYQKPIEESIF